MQCIWENGKKCQHNTCCDTPKFMGNLPNIQSVDREAHAESKWLYVFDLPSALHWSETNRTINKIKNTDGDAWLLTASTISVFVFMKGILFHSDSRPHNAVVPAIFLDCTCMRLEWIFLLYNKSESLSRRL